MPTPRLRLHVVILVGLLLLAGCSSSPPPDPPVEDGELAATIEVAWAPGRSDLVLSLDRPAPDDLRVRITADSAGAVQLARAELVQLDNATLRVPDPVTLTEGERYHVEVLSGDRRVAERNLTAVDAPIGEPVGLQATATYEAEQTHVRETPSGISVTNAIGEATLTVNGTEHRFRFDGRGGMHLVQGNLSMQLDLHTYLAEDTGDRTTQLVLAGNGTWRIDEPPTHGQGRVLAFDSRFIAREDKRIAPGDERPAERFHRWMVLEGSIQAERDNGSLWVWQQETSWSDPATGSPFWIEGNETRRFTFSNETSWRNSTWNRSVDPGGAGPRLSELVDVGGLRPAELAVNDTVVLAGPDDVRIRYVATGTRSLDTGAGTLEVLDVRGSSGGPVNGSERWSLVHGGSLAGLPVIVELDHRLDGQEFTMRMGLVEVSSP